MKKRIVSIVLVLGLLMSLFVLTACNSEDKVSLNVYNWGEYIDLSVIETFEKETGIDVNYTTYDSNEIMYSKIKSGAASYDVVIPSEYMISKMINEDMLAELNFDNIKNYSLIDSKYKGLAHDKDNKYSIPYTWGTVAILYNSKYVSEEDVAEKSIDILWNEKYSGKILMFDNPRDAFALSLKRLGYSMNSTNEEEWKKAAEALEAQKPLVQAYVMDMIFDKMESEEAWIAPYYAGDAFTIHEDNPDVKYFLPSEGTNLFVDAMCVLKTSQHKNEAEMFIDFMCRTDIALKNAIETGYATPQTEVRKQLDTALAEDPVVYPSEEALENSEVFINLPTDINKLQSDLWTSLKIDSE